MLKPTATWREIRKVMEMQETKEFVIGHVGAQRGTDNSYHGKKRVGIWFSELYMQGKTNPQNRMIISPRQNPQVLY